MNAFEAAILMDESTRQHYQNLAQIAKLENENSDLRRELVDLTAELAFIKSKLSAYVMLIEMQEQTLQQASEELAAALGADTSLKH